MAGWKPSASFRGSIASRIAGGVYVSGERELNEDRVDGVVAVQRGDGGEKSRLGQAGGEAQRPLGDPGFARRGSLAGDVDGARPGSSPTRTTARPGTTPRAARAATPEATSSRIAFATAAPSRISEVIAVLWSKPLA